MTLMRLSAFTLLLVLAILSVQPTAAQYSSVKILGISVEGNENTDADMIRMSSGLTPGTTITGEKVQTAIRQLWRLNLFSDVKVLVDRELADGIYITIKVEEYPRLGRYEIEGNEKLKEKDIKEILNFYRGQIVSPAMLARAKQKLLDKYKEKGFLLAQIDISKSSSSADSNRVVVKFTFNEGDKVQVEKIRFYGNNAFDDGKLKKQFKEIKEDRWWRSADFDKDNYRDDLKKVIQFYQNEGYRDAEILRDSLYYNQTRDDMFIDIWVYEGPLYHFGEMTWDGNKIFTDKELSAQLRFDTGDVYSKKKLDEAVYQHVGSLYYDRGYIFATITPQEKLNPDDEHILDIRFIVNESKQAKINEIKITGNSKTKEKVIRREIKAFPGQTFNRSLLERSQREVWMLNYFANVEPKVNPISEEKVNLEFAVEEKSTDTANMSAGWSERDKLIGSIGVSMANLFGNGQQLNFDWMFGRYYRSFNIGFTEPWLFDTPTLAGFSFYDTKRDAYYIGYKQVSRGASVRLGRRLRWPDNFFRGDMIYSLDRTELSNFNQYIVEANPNNIINEDWPLISSSVTFLLSRNSLDRPEFPTRGSDVSLRAELAGTFLGGNVDFHKWTFNADWFIPSFWNLVMYTSVHAGYLDGIGDGANIPYLEYFFIGGDGLSRSTPLRGYDDPLSGYRMVDEGGQTILKYTAELRIPIAPNPTIFGLLFAEAGNTWADFRRANPFDMKRSVGIGGRVFMPMVGIIGFDYGYGFDRVDNQGDPNPKWKMHFVFGRSF
ncbi:MAG: outer membrane protein assembly factor BamA [candidate division KSB1 bacterium]|nr:outer membrane protein assembly factor BamA [candidate division KSB1 bacterium]